jgi:hypothetical protein
MLLRDAVRSGTHQAACPCASMPVPQDLLLRQHSRTTLRHSFSDYKVCECHPACRIGLERDHTQSEHVDFYCLFCFQQSPSDYMAAVTAVILHLTTQGSVCQRNAASGCRCAASVSQSGKAAVAAAATVQHKDGLWGRRQTCCWRCRSFCRGHQGSLLHVSLQCWSRSLSLPSSCQLRISSCCCK